MLSHDFGICLFKEIFQAFPYSCVIADGAILYLDSYRDLYLVQFSSIYDFEYRSWYKYPTQFSSTEIRFLQPFLDLNFSPILYDKDARWNEKFTFNNIRKDNHHCIKSNKNYREAWRQKYCNLT